MKILVSSSVGAAAFALVACPGAALPAVAADQLPVQTGPSAAPPPTPPFAKPPPSPLFKAPTGPTVAPAAADRPFVITEVRVTSHPPAGVRTTVARFQPGWRPRAAIAGAPRLDRQPRDNMDAAWVRRQFALNGLIGRQSSVDRV